MGKRLFGEVPVVIAFRSSNRQRIEAMCVEISFCKSREALIIDRLDNGNRRWLVLILVKNTLRLRYICERVFQFWWSFGGCLHSGNHFAVVLEKVGFLLEWRLIHRTRRRGSQITFRSIAGVEQDRQDIWIRLLERPALRTVVVPSTQHQELFSPEQLSLRITELRRNTKQCQL